MASIYDKALKRKDFSGVTNKNKEEVASESSESKFLPESAFFLFSFFFSIHALVDKTKAQKKEEKDKAAKVDDPKAGADVGKIVNLIASDSNKVRNILFFLVFFLLIPSFRSFKHQFRSIFYTQVHIIQFL